MVRAQQSDNLCSFQTQSDDPSNVVHLAGPKTWAPGLYPNDADKAQQLGLMVAFQQRKQRSEPQIVGQMMFFKIDTPLYGNGRQNCGGPVLGWNDFPIVQATGAERYRYYTKETIANEINVEPITPERMARLQEESDRIRASLPPGDARQIVISIEASSDLFKEYFPGRTE
tara:strand:+ start:993 stop:1505 length:513 start_codon:yes stop_codon:yes gene_type:complete